MGQNIIFAAGLGAFAQGSADAWTSPALPHISECTEDCDFNFSSTVGSWIGSIYPIGCLISALLGIFINANLTNHLKCHT